MEKLEHDFIEILKNQSHAKVRLKKARQLLGALREEKEKTLARKEHLENVLQEFSRRKEELAERIQIQSSRFQSEAIGLLVELERTSIAPEAEDAQLVRSLRAEVLRRRARENLNAIHAIRVDEGDISRLEAMIVEEQNELNYILGMLAEQESLLDFHRRLQIDILRKNVTAQVQSLERYQKRKTANNELESLIGDLNVRREFQRFEDQQAQIQDEFKKATFDALKGKLSFPLLGAEVKGKYGQYFDPEMRLKVFRKGVELVSEESREVKSIAHGRVVFSGRLPEYGEVAVLDHGHDYFSLSGRLAQLKVKEGQFVRQGDVIGLTAGADSALYFEIRSKNVPVNPLQWLSKSSKF